MGRKTLVLSAFLALLSFDCEAATVRACSGGVSTGAFRIKVKTPTGGDPLPIRRMNIIPANSKLLYEPLQMPENLKKNGRIALVIVPADAEQRAASGASVLEAHDANANGEWTVPYRAGVVLLVFGPQGLDEKRLTNLVTKDEDLLDDLARFAQQTVDLEASLEQVNSLDDEDVDDDPSRPGRATPVEQALFTLTRALNPSSAFFNPLGAGKSIGPTTRSTWAASTFFDNAGGLFPGSGALGMVRQWLMPDSEFRAVYAETTEVDGLALCAQKQIGKSKNRIVYMWGYKPVNSGAPKLSVPQLIYFPSGARSTFSMRIAAPDDWALTNNVHDWALASASTNKEIPVRVRPAARGWMDIDLRKTVINPGAYKLKGRWDWDTVVVEGDLHVSPLGDMKLAHVTAESQLHLVEGTGMIPFELEGTDFEFVEHVTLKRAGALGAANTELEYRLPAGWRAGPQNKLELEIDGSRYRSGDYLLAMQQSGGSSKDVPMTIMPPLPRISGLPLRLNSGEPRQQITLRGSGLDRIESFESDGVKFELAPAATDTQRDVTVLLASNNTTGLRIPAAYRLTGLSTPIRLPVAFQVAGPKPRLASATAGAPDDQPVAMRDGEVLAGSIASFTLKAENADAPATLNIECSEPGLQIQPLKIRLGERRADAKLGSIGAGTWFVTFDPGTVGQSGCTLNGTIETDASGRSASLALGKVVRLPRMDNLVWTDEKSQGGYAAVLHGTDLETIERIGWDAQNGVPVTAVPKTTGDKQSLKLTLPWPPPSPLAPLQIWLRGDPQPRTAKVASR
jgi:hypothetical protein